MKLFITGGMGFIGSNFIRRMYERYPGYTIINFDALTYAGNEDNLADIEVLESKKGTSRRYHFVKGDITKPEELDAAILPHTPDAIINFAAESHVDRSFVAAAAFINTNVVGVHYLLELSRKKNTPFIQISTDEVYGDTPEGYSTEESPLRPSNPYAASKAAADLLVLSYIRSHNTPAKIIRGSNNFGPYQYPEKLIPLAITNILEGKKVPIHGNGTHVRTWLHTDDFADAIDLILHRAAQGSVYNVAGTEATNILLLRRVAEVLGKNYDDFFEHVGDRPGADFRYAPNADKLYQDFGWKPAHPIEKSFGELVAWYQNHEEWWHKIKEKREFLDHYEKQRHAKYY